MVLGVPGLVLGHMGAEAGVTGWLEGGFKHGLAESLLSPLRISSLSAPSVSPSIREDVNVLKSGMFRCRVRFFFDDFFAQSFFLESITVLPIFLQSEFFLSIFRRKVFSTDKYIHSSVYFFSHDRPP